MNGLKVRGVGLLSHSSKLVIERVLIFIEDGEKVVVVG